jgi:hypothetical protein
MDAYAFALALGTAGLAAMTVLGFHHDEVARTSGTGDGRLNVSVAYSNKHDSREPGGAA